jgi:hypothetical protein
MAVAEIPLAAASVLTPASHVSKLPLPQAAAANAGEAVDNSSALNSSTRAKGRTDMQTLALN